MNLEVNRQTLRDLPPLAKKHGAFQLKFIESLVPLGITQPIRMNSYPTSQLNLAPGN